jgi:hypothetical protein
MADLLPRVWKNTRSPSFNSSFSINSIVLYCSWAVRGNERRYTSRETNCVNAEQSIQFSVLPPKQYRVPHHLSITSNSGRLVNFSAITSNKIPYFTCKNSGGFWTCNTSSETRNPVSAICLPEPRGGWGRFFWGVPPAERVVTGVAFAVPDPFVPDGVIAALGAGFTGGALTGLLNKGCTRWQPEPVNPIQISNSKIRLFIISRTSKIIIGTNRWGLCQLKLTDPWVIKQVLWKKAHPPTLRLFRYLYACTKSCPFYRIGNFLQQKHLRNSYE